MATPVVSGTPIIERHGSRHPDRLAIWSEDLESIRRSQPLVDPALIVPQRVTVQARPAAGQGTTRSARRGDSKVTSAATASLEVVVLDDDDDGGVAPAATALLSFYGQPGGRLARGDGPIRYQDHGMAHPRRYPSRRNGLGFDMPRLRLDHACADPIRTLQDVQPYWDHAMFMGSPPAGFDDATDKYWSRDNSDTSLLFGFPLLGDVVFFRPTNYGGARSTCFFKALAYLVYGDQSLYRRVQAEHLQHYGDVLEWEDHPRHKLYTRMNEKFYNTAISIGDPSSTDDREVDTVANFYQLLSIPQIWMPLDMLDVTADVYNLFIVVFTINESSPAQVSTTGSSTRVRPEVTEVSTKGSYNARHVFLLFNGFHYQPMVPNEYLASEFTFPRVTYENIKALSSSRETDHGKDSIDLRWRNTWGRGLDRRKGALPVDHVFYRESLRTAMKGSH